MASHLDRRTFLRRAALGGGVVMAGPLAAYAARSSEGGAAAARTRGYGPLIDRGALALPRGFRYRILSRAGQPMTDGRPTPTAFDGMAAFRGPGRTTILIRNHENRSAPGAPSSLEIPVVVPAELRYDPDGGIYGGNTKLVVAPGLRVRAQFAVLGGTTTNCAGGRTPWGSWITCEEAFVNGQRPHGYVFEVDARANGPVQARPIRGAGRFVHEAVAWFGGALYETEDRGDASLYRYVPNSRPRRAGDLAASRGRLQALRILGGPSDTRKGFPVGRRFAVDWVDVRVPEPSSNDAPTSTRAQAQAAGAAVFSRQEGAWAVGRDRVFFDCTDGGAAGKGQIWELDPRRNRLRLVFESAGEGQLDGPDNLTLAPATGDVLVCEDGDGSQFVRGLTRGGRIYDVVRSIANDTEFCGACFSPGGRVLFVNQQGIGTAVPGVTYAIWGPWERRGRGRR
jgi:secreted PhoX family phosphatase